MFCYSTGKNDRKAGGTVTLDTGCCITGSNIRKPSLHWFSLCLTILYGFDLLLDPQLLQLFPLYYIHTQ